MAIAFIAIALICILITIYLVFAKIRHQLWTRLGVPQLSPHILFGDFRGIVLGKTSVQEQYQTIYNRAKAAGYKHVGLYNTIVPEYVPVDPELIKNILIRDFQHFSSHGIYHSEKDITNHLFAIDGKKWKDRRIKLTPIFTTGKMKMMFDLVLQRAQGINPAIQHYLDKGESINIKDICARFTTDSIGTVAFGLNCDTLTHGDHKFRQIGKKAFKPDLWAYVAPLLFPHRFLEWAGFKGVPRDVEEYFEGVVKETIKYRESSKDNREDFLQLMIQLKNKGTLDESFLETKTKSFVTEQEIINEAFLFYLAGFETSSSTMTFMLYELAKNPEIQEKLREEILENLEQTNDQKTYDNIMKMDYLDRVLKEALRKYPVVSVIPRECTLDYKVPFSDAIIPKGTRVMIPAIGLQMDPTFYPDPERFNPDNFLPENRAKRPDMAWIPFGEGPRMCIGLRFGVMQSKIGIVELLTKWRFSLDESRKRDYTPSTSSLIYMFKDDVMLKAQPI